jgi:hypothetical protein
VGFDIDVRKVQRVLLKLAAGHAAYELSETQLGLPKYFVFAPLASLSKPDREAFEDLESGSSGYPEVGSRSFQRVVLKWPSPSDNQWIMVQPGRYRYAAFLAERVVVKMVLSEYLASEVQWS